MKLGYALERADSTARVLDVKYFVLLLGGVRGIGLDSYQWQVILRALSAHRAFHWAYGEDVSASRVAHFLIQNNESPRSLDDLGAGSAGASGRACLPLRRRRSMSPPATARAPWRTGWAAPISKTSSTRACTTCPISSANRRDRQSCAGRLFPRKGLRMRLKMITHHTVYRDAPVSFRGAKACARRLRPLTGKRSSTGLSH